jgi:hypothetical protein
VPAFHAMKGKDVHCQIRLNPRDAVGGFLSDPVSPAAWPATHWPVWQAVEEGCSWEVGLRITPQGLCPGLAQ